MNISHPIFIECLNYNDDVFWKSIFENLSYGICPLGSFLNNDSFYSSCKKFNYSFTNKPVKDVYKDIKKILSEKYFNKSKFKDNYVQFYKEIEKNQKKSKDFWLIKKKSLRDIIIQNYLIENKKKYSLTEYQIKKVYNFINIAFVLKILNKDDVISDEFGNIKNINYISFDKNKAILEFDIFNNFLTENESSKIKIKKKYLKKL